MASPIEALLEVANVKRVGSSLDYGAIDVTTLNVTLGLYQRLGIEAAVLRVVDMDTQYTVRFNPDSAQAGMLEIWDTIKDGKLFLFFDKYQLVVLIEKTLETKFLIFTRVTYRAYMSTPFTPILISDSEKDLSKTLGWVERRVQKCSETFPSLMTNEKVAL